MRKQFLGLFTAAIITIGSVVSFSHTNVEARINGSANFSKSYSLTGNGATDMVNIAMAQVGKNGGQLGYSSNPNNAYSGEEWCADFVSDCAILAGQSAAIPANDNCKNMQTAIKNAGGDYVSASSAKAGDILFYGSGGGDHVEIVYAQNGSTLYTLATIGGNSGNSHNYYSLVKKHTSQGSSPNPYAVMRPNYKGSIIPPIYTVDTRFPSNIKAYTIGTGNQSVYQSHGGAAESGRYITGSTDECVIKTVYTDGWCDITYPASGVMRPACVPLSYFINSGITHYKFTGSYTETFRRSDRSQSFGNIDSGDSCIAVGKNGDSLQVIYPISGGYKLGWIPSSINHDPLSAVDIIEGGAGNVHVRGWAFDPDTTSQSLEIHVYIGGLAENSASEGYGGIIANTERTDVNNVHGCGNDHGFDVTLSTAKRGNQAVYVYTFDTTTGDNLVIGSKTITISEPLKTYTISYNANGGTGVPASQTKTQGTDLTLSSTKPTRTGYTFLGWSTSSTATTATYTAGGKYTANAAATLYAVWKANTYTISYNANGGSGVPASQTKTYGTDLTLSSTKPTRTGYDFLGWSTSSTATSATYSAGGKYTANASVTLYAVWKALPTVKLGDVNNDGDIDFADATLILQADSGKITLTANQKTAADVNKDGDVDFADATLVLQYDSGKINSFNNK